MESHGSKRIQVEQRRPVADHWVRFESCGEIVRKKNGRMVVHLKALMDFSDETRQMVAYCTLWKSWEGALCFQATLFSSYSPKVWVLTGSLR